MAYYRTEENVYCDSIKTEVSAGQTVDNISIKSHGPCKISGIIAKFSSSTSGDFTVKLTRQGITVDLINVTLDENKDVVATDINVWVPEASGYNYSESKLTITNGTQASANVIIDYTY